MKISFLILLLSVSLSTQAGERLQGISGSMGKSTNLFSKLFDDDPQNEDVDTPAPIKQQREKITEETKLEAEHEAAQIKKGERHRGIKDDSARFAPDQQKKSADTLPEIDLISDINGQFEDTINKLQSTEKKLAIKAAVHTKPTQLLINDSSNTQTTNKTSALHATNETATIQAAREDCVTEKVYSLDVDNAAQYKRLEDFPFSYECVIQR